ncbi:hypothetical protein ACT4S2_00870 [Kocuria turfanensis]|uniref:hypothetical protein n=1 Tax=Kocuria turfanensis TaxID=388357 RepID=UPI0040362596
MSVEHLRDGLPDLVERLNPLVVGTEAASELLVETRGGHWTAFFDSSAADPAVDRAVGVLAEQLGTTGVMAGWRPHPVATEAEEIDAEGQYLDEDVLGGAGRTEFVVVGPEGGPPTSRCGS